MNLREVTDQNPLSSGQTTCDYFAGFFLLTPFLILNCPLGEILHGPKDPQVAAAGCRGMVNRRKDLVF